jgi:hypothetical protein
VSPRGQAKRSPARVRPGAFSARGEQKTCRECFRLLCMRKDSRPVFKHDSTKEVHYV